MPSGYKIAALYTANMNFYELNMPCSCVVIAMPCHVFMGTDEQNRGRRMGPYGGHPHQGNYADAMAVDGDHMVGGAAT